MSTRTYTTPSTKPFSHHTAADIASVMDHPSDIVLSMIYDRAPMAADAGIPIYSPDPAVLRRALRPAPLRKPSSSPRPTAYVPMVSRNGSTSSLGTFRSAPGQSSLRSGSPAPHSSHRLPSPYARIDRKYAQAELHTNTEMNTFPGFDAAMGEYAAPENMARRWWRKSDRLGWSVRTQAHAHLFRNRSRDN